MGSDHKFDSWKSVVDQHLRRMCGMVADDLPDYRYHDAYVKGEAPMLTAKKALAAAKRDMGL